MPTGSDTTYRKHNKPAYGPLGDSLDRYPEVASFLLLVVRSNSAHPPAITLYPEGLAFQVQPNFATAEYVDALGAVEGAIALGAARAPIPW
jgi:hypothetical protein